ncbi:hypothetical protein AJ85_14370 [Alkalihalobacillus alcalophilus ATCC 27647 = CGMCC 1.3604]|uniref:Uncharacterized protein n=1 Tax=Alkalihalobacillus alcalophilus ATCC 27647 = CGMCC 1.3604 TaxID=1218173 RepID=A0A094YXP1_ALKAL|nr:hypothetical protein BALCAV_0205025 [Alkalihalobacillus alcalophilus ATCC 27647 = CGMCC 1.3604]THG89945.1 hypothetical protein AJ85_14370 [Alkalihalobacillus alcalophilus ATCC 27647 = CGMCC 1.3604]
MAFLIYHLKLYVLSLFVTITFKTIFDFIRGDELFNSQALSFILWFPILFTIGYTLFTPRSKKTY